MSLIGETDQIIRRPTMADIDFLIDNIREDDVIEIKAMCNLSVRDVLEDTPNLDKNAYVWEKDGKVIAIFGVTPVDDRKNVGVVWMLGTTFFDNYFVTFIRECKNVFEQVVKDYDYVFNYVYTENKKSIEWLKMLGFKVRDAEPIGINGSNFNKFEMVRKNV